MCHERLHGWLVFITLKFKAWSVWKGYTFVAHCMGHARARCVGLSNAPAVFDLSVFIGVAPVVFLSPMF